MLRFEVAVVERDAFDRPDLESRAWRHRFRRRAQQGGIERALPKAARQAENLHHARVLQLVIRGPYGAGVRTSDWPEAAVRGAVSIPRYRNRAASSGRRANRPGPVRSARATRTRSSIR